MEYCDGSVLAHLGNPDMRTPIAHALAWPERVDSCVGRLDRVAISRLDFRDPDSRRFPCLRLAADAAREAGSAPIWLNAANEVAVAAFLAEEIGFGRIPAVIEETLARVSAVEPESLPVVEQADSDARAVAAALVAGESSGTMRYRG